MNTHTILTRRPLWRRLSTWAWCLYWNWRISSAKADIVAWLEDIDKADEYAEGYGTTEQFVEGRIAHIEYADRYIAGLRRRIAVAEAS